MFSLKRFSESRSGNFAIMFSVMAIPLVGGVALAVDYTNMSRYRSDLQNATDVGTVFAARYYELNQRLPSKDDVKTFIVENSAFTDVKITTLQYKDNQVIVDSWTSYSPYIFQMVSNKPFDVAVRSAAAVAEDVDLEIVMALDTTYSMTANDKIGGLKTAATNFANTLFDAVNAKTHVKIGLVPFSQYVNVGLGNRSASWLDVPDDSSSTTTTDVGCRWVKTIINYSVNCRPASYMNDGVLVEYQACDPLYGPDEWTCEPITSTSSSTWRGCVGTRGTTSNMLTLTDTMPSSTATNKSKFPGMMNTWCARPLMPLTDDRATVVNEIAAFSASGNTYIADGVMWGLRVLSPQAPFTEGADPKTSVRKVRKIMVLMTDGENQNSPRIDTSADHNGSDLARADSWTQRACNYVKQEGVAVYTVTFGTQVPISAKNIMKRCASSAANFYDAASSDKLDQAFQDIARNLTMLRLTQ
ncbi:MAG: VWA domain-containing protein [Notoacmeibacter sp.]|nr:VWA domain-containing protein [Notoacmeibacter sp.]MCC0033425.1 VWA domain-containing protein [Brucellaceae bacterium]